MKTSERLSHEGTRQQLIKLAEALETIAENLGSTGGYFRAAAIKAHHLAEFHTFPCKRNSGESATLSAKANDLSHACTVLADQRGLSKAGRAFWQSSATLLVQLSRYHSARVNR